MGKRKNHVMNQKNELATFMSSHSSGNLPSSINALPNSFPKLDLEMNQYVENAINMYITKTIFISPLLCLWVYYTIMFYRLSDFFTKKNQSLKSVGLDHESK